MRVPKGARDRLASRLTDFVVTEADLIEDNPLFASLTRLNHLTTPKGYWLAGQCVRYGDHFPQGAEFYNVF